MRSRHILTPATIALISLTACAGGINSAAPTVPSTANSSAGSSFASTAFSTGDVFTMSNAASGNAILRFHRGSDGHLSPAGSVSTGGSGSGSGLNGASDTVKYGLFGMMLFASDAGSNDIVSVEVGATGMKVLDKVSSFGTTPASLAIRNNLIYVLNIGSNTITGFTVDSSGKMTHLAGSTVSLSGSPSDDPVDLHFGPDGSTLIATQKLSNVIDVFTVDSHGIPHGPAAHTSEGLEPFGFAVTGNGHVLISEAFGGAPHMAAVSSYAIASNGGLTEISESVRNHQTASCWLELSRDQQFAYTANTGSGNVSGYRVADNGTVSLLNKSGIAGTDGTGSAPIDLGISGDDRFAYVLASGTHVIDEFRRNSDGTLARIGKVSGLPAFAIGLSLR